MFKFIYQNNYIVHINTTNITMAILQITHTFKVIVKCVVVQLGPGTSN